MMNKSYSEVIRLETFEERFAYLKLTGSVGMETFGYDRYLNQKFYTAKEWRAIRDYVIVRDNGCDLAHPDFSIGGKFYIHHINPISKDDILLRSDLMLNPENLILVSFETHNAIHYGAEETQFRFNGDRKPNDTCPWKGVNDGQYSNYDKKAFGNHRS